MEGRGFIAEVGSLKSWRRSALSAFKGPTVMHIQRRKNGKRLVQLNSIHFLRKNLFSLI